MASWISSNLGRRDHRRRLVRGAMQDSERRPGDASLPMAGAAARIRSTVYASKMALKQRSASYSQLKFFSGCHLRTNLRQAFLTSSGDTCEKNPVENNGKFTYTSIIAAVKFLQEKNLNLIWKLLQTIFRLVPGVQEHSEYVRNTALQNGFLTIYNSESGTHCFIVYVLSESTHGLQIITRLYCHCCHENIEPFLLRVAFVHMQHDRHYTPCQQVAKIAALYSWQEREVCRLASRKRESGQPRVRELATAPRRPPGKNP